MEPDAESDEGRLDTVRRIERSIIEYHVFPDDAEVFMDWAVGKDFRTIDPNLYASRWNEKHGKYLILEPTGYLMEDVPKMVKIWRENTRAISKSEKTKKRTP